MTQFRPSNVSCGQDRTSPYLSLQSKLLKPGDLITIPMSPGQETVGPLSSEVIPVLYLVRLKAGQVWKVPDNEFLPSSVPSLVKKHGTCPVLRFVFQGSVNVKAGIRRSGFSFAWIAESFVCSSVPVVSELILDTRDITEGTLEITFFALSTATICRPAACLEPLSDAAAYESIQYRVLYDFIFPTMDLCCEEPLYVKFTGPCPYFSLEDRHIHLFRDCQADLLTYFNAFTAGKWLKNTNVRKVSAFLDIRGTVEVALIAQRKGERFRLASWLIDARERGLYQLPETELEEDCLLGLSVRTVSRTFGTSEKDAPAEKKDPWVQKSTPATEATDKALITDAEDANSDLDPCSEATVAVRRNIHSSKALKTVLSSDIATAGSETVELPYDPGEETVIYGGGWLTDAPETRDVRLGIAITTFRREREVKAAVSRLTRDIAAHPLYRDRIDVTVVDNGNTLKEEDLPGALLIQNRNLGGTGGFTRGLIHYQETGRHTHCLFMDDDASCEAGSVFRSMSFQRHATDPLLALSGAMLFDNIKFMQWENGAWFDGGCHSVNRDFDLRDPAKLWENEQEGCVPAGKRIYGAWWFFFFPLSGVKNYSLPFFVRGDDIDFSYANDFHVASLNGVSCWQQDFKTKESPLTAYLFLRSHMVHHMTLPQLKCSFGILWNILWGHFRRYNASYFYGTAAAVNLAMSHVLKGPKFFEDNIEPTEVLRKVKEISQCEKAEPLTEEEFKTLKKAEKNLKMAPLTKTMRRLTFNGHLLPKGMAKNTAEEYLPKWMTPNPDRFFRRSQVTVTDQLNMKKVVLRRSSGLYFKNLAVFMLLALRLCLTLPFLRGKYKKAEMRQRNLAFWKSNFVLRK